MIRSFAQNLVRFSLSFLQQRMGVSFLLGSVCGLYILSCVQRFQNLVSDSPEVMTGIGLAIVMGIWLGLPQRAIVSSEDSGAETVPHQKRIHFTLLILSFWSICYPFLLAQFNQVLHWVTLTQMTNVVFLTGLMTLSAMTLILPVVFWSTRLFWFATLTAGARKNSRTTITSQLARFLTGVSVSLILSAYWLVPVFGWTGTLLIPLIATLAFCCVPWIGTLCKSYLPEYSHWLKLDLFQTDTQSHSDFEATKRAVAPPRIPMVIRVGSYVMSLATGILLVVVSRVLFQLYPDSLYLKVTIWAGFLLGIAAAFAFLQARKPGKLAQMTSSLSLVTALTGIGCLALFPLLVSWMLYANAYIEYALLLSVIRGGLTAALFCLLGTCWGGWLKLSSPTQYSRVENSTITTLPVWQPLCLLAGMFSCLWLIGSAVIELKTIAVVTSLVLLSLAVLVRLTHFRLPTSRWRAAAMTCGLVLLTTGLFSHNNYDVHHSAKLLFSTNTFTGLRYGLKPELLPHLDEGRCLSELEGQYGTFTIWSYRENQIQIRRSGLPFGVTSVDAGLCPHTTGELMPFVIPVVLHERPADVLFLGLGAGVGVNSSLDFPVQHVTCLEPDRSLVKLYHEEIAPRNAISAFDSERVELVQMPIALAMAARTDTETQYDLIISNPAHSVVTQSQAEYTAEFYRNVSRHLNADGIFCQRFQHIDFGAQPLRVMAQTFRAAFQQVLAIEIANGETLFLGTNSAQGFIRNNLIDRIQAPQVRRTLAQVGWDWSVLLNLAAYSNKALADMTVDFKTSVNHSSTGNFAFTLPYEMMRWGMKQEEIRKMVSAEIRSENPVKEYRSSRLLNWMEGEKNDPIILRRLSEVTAQNRLMARYPDQYWKYRKPAKDQITENPRSLIKQVAAENLHKEDYIHDEDKRRMFYFKALSDAMEKASPTADQIGRVTTFTATYDPMISYFMHDEVAELYNKSDDAPDILEFSHRLHAINYGSANDRSIVSVVRALELAATDPSLFQEPGQQWDHLNGLLQSLKYRWDNRSQARPLTSKQALHDIELSISGIERAFETMDEIQAQANVSAQDWQLRKKVLERTLVRPLETYHERVLPHHYKKSREERKKLLDGLNLPSIPSL
ncbi:spermine/spermidine synthase domain-containing protein [Gimesia algae]|uniref:Spermidine synthase n=1 Tax=Gimesia algae TaxID=2527971 RepID=A0A517VKG2_9PLAN|nr:hypothetical protein [Gimesia algae]QDT93511.1 spermidine synthase [Gimesia algae]